MKKDFRFVYKKDGIRKETHILADSYGEARDQFFEYIDFLRYMGLDVETVAKNERQGIDDV